MLFHLIKGSVALQFCGPSSSSSGFSRKSQSFAMTELNVMFHVFVCEEQEVWIILVFPPAQVEVKPISAKQLLSFVSLKKVIPFTVTIVEHFHGSVEVKKGNQTVLFKIEKGPVIHIIHVFVCRCDQQRSSHCKRMPYVYLTR